MVKKGVIKTNPSHGGFSLDSLSNTNNQGEKDGASAFGNNNLSEQSSSIGTFRGSLHSPFRRVPTSLEKERFNLMGLEYPTHKKKHDLKEKGSQFFFEVSSKKSSDDSVRTEPVIVEMSSDSSEDNEEKGKVLSPKLSILVILPSSNGVFVKKGLIFLLLK